MHMRMRMYIHLCDVHSHAHVYEGINVLEIQFLHVRIYTHCQLALAIAGAIDLHCANACARWLRLYLYTCIRTYVRTGNALPATNIRDRDVRTCTHRTRTKNGENDPHGGLRRLLPPCPCGIELNERHRGDLAAPVAANAHSRD